MAARKKWPEWATEKLKELVEAGTNQVEIKRTLRELGFSVSETSISTHINSNNFVCKVVKEAEPNYAERRKSLRGTAGSEAVPPGHPLTWGPISNGMMYPLKYSPYLIK